MWYEDNRIEWWCKPCWIEGLTDGDDTRVEGVSRILWKAEEEDGETDVDSDVE
jgi:hypothetical protein